MNYKNKIVSSVLLVLFYAGAVSAGDLYESGEYKYDDGKLSNGYYEAIIDKDIIEFEAERDGHLIKMEWSNYNESDFAYYKIMRSETNENPIYPEQPAIRVIDNNDLNYLKLENYSDKEAFYRVCAITKENKRYCSNVVKLDGFEKEELDKKKYEYEAKKAEYQKEITAKKAEYEKKLLEKKETAKTKAEEYKAKLEEKNKEFKDKREDFIKSKKVKLEEKLAKRADIIVEKFVKKIDENFDSNEQKQESIKKVMEKLEALGNKNEKLKDLTSYINQKLEEKLNKFQDDGFDEIESIFSEFK